MRAKVTFYLVNTFPAPGRIVTINVVKYVHISIGLSVFLKQPPRNYYTAINNICFALPGTRQKESEYERASG
jgi:hypothetical protein